MSDPLMFTVGEWASGRLSPVSIVDPQLVLRRWFERLAKELGSAAELSRRSGIPTSTLSNIQSADRRVTLDLMAKAARAAGVPLSISLRQLSGIAQEIEDELENGIPPLLDKRPPS